MSRRRARPALPHSWIRLGRRGVPPGHPCEQQRGNGRESPAGHTAPGSGSRSPPPPCPLQAALPGGHEWVSESPGPVAAPALCAAAPAWGPALHGCGPGLTGEAPSSGPRAQVPACSTTQRRSQCPPPVGCVLPLPLQHALLPVRARGRRCSGGSPDRTLIFSNSVNLAACGLMLSSGLSRGTGCFAPIASLRAANPPIVAGAEVEGDVQWAPQRAGADLRAVPTEAYDVHIPPPASTQHRALPPVPVPRLLWVRPSAAQPGEAS